MKKESKEQEENKNEGKEQGSNKEKERGQGGGIRERKKERRRKRWRENEKEARAVSKREKERSRGGRDRRGNIVEAVGPDPKGRRTRVVVEASPSRALLSTEHIRALLSARSFKFPCAVELSAEPRGRVTLLVWLAPQVAGARKPNAIAVARSADGGSGRAVMMVVVVVVVAAVTLSTKLYRIPCTVTLCSSSRARPVLCTRRIPR